MLIILSTKRFFLDPCSQINSNMDPVTVRIEANRTNTLWKFPYLKSRSVLNDMSVIKKRNKRFNQTKTE